MGTLPAPVEDFHNDDEATDDNIMESAFDQPGTSGVVKEGHKRKTGQTATTKAKQANKKNDISDVVIDYIRESREREKESEHKINSALSAGVQDETDAWGNWLMSDTRAVPKDTFCSNMRETFELAMRYLPDQVNTGKTSTLTQQTPYVAFGTTPTTFPFVPLQPQQQTQGLFTQLNQDGTGSWIQDSESATEQQ